MPVALGARFDLPRDATGCGAGEPAGRVRERYGRYDAVAPGRWRIRCQERTLRYVVRPVHRLAIRRVGTLGDPPDSERPGPAGAAAGQRLDLVPEAFAADGEELVLGSGAEVRWEYSGVLADAGYPGCGDILPWCPPRIWGHAQVTAAGRGAAVAHFGGHSTRLEVVATAR
ncbi:MAG TPA: hypothetical protein VGQ83_39545 [Polyangia bacterium]|jgi:hypothetical protein